MIANGSGTSLPMPSISASSSSEEWRAIGEVHRAHCRRQEAVSAFEKANELEPMDTKTLLSLALAHREAGHNKRAAEVYRSVTLLEPQHPRAHYLRASCLRAAGCVQEALARFRHHLRLFPRDEQASFWVAALTGDSRSVGAMPAELVAGIFDKYAGSFDDHLVGRLQYRMPQLIMEAVIKAAASSSSSSSACQAEGHCSTRDIQPEVLWQRGIDLGCGTGLVGALLRRHVKYLEAVDLSPAMVDKAIQRGCYDRVALGDIVAHIQTSCSSGSSAVNQQQALPPYNLLVAADVFIYIGDLAPVMCAAAKHSSKGALFAFSTESLDDREDAHTCSHSSQVLVGQHTDTEQTDVAVQRYCLTPSGRYAHSTSYLEEVAADNGWRIRLLRKEVIRCNAGKPVHGHLCVMELI